ncbi:vacuolar membrane-associated protein iml1 [Didymosphaeria variabile]|uniref:Vacuolar membrane-associated protein IML1 n=1 Tax=Didymosphaeria variabile TaxID=1932322 RepID=A0A9W8XJ77_9PLEO|nr:vacuolar membrane-associated protein iml1 [Didymosphaeria variabile]KAJ4352288.1 vacuolar membrane-associated protein iml1 [Didymosphaeria variabile]
MNGKRTRVRKVCTLWTHDDNFSKDDVVFNSDKFSELPAAPGSLIQVIALKYGTATRDFQSSSRNLEKDGTQTKHEDPNDAATDVHSRRSRKESIKVTLDENGSVIQEDREVDTDKSYIFVAKPFPTELKSKHSNLQVSIAEKIAKVFGLRNRMQVVVTLADEHKHSASHVEVTFRDEYLARADMWRMSIAELSNRTVYRGQKLLFMGTIKATVKNVYINGQSTHSGYFSSMTKPVFRSESARYVLFIQMSKEMWDFDAEGAGEIMFNKVVNGFLPDLFKRWLRINARHLVTIILFTRMQYDPEITPKQPIDTTNNNGFDSRTGRFRDYYRVVVSDMASGDWVNILYQLKKEFRSFLKDVSLIPRQDYSFSKAAITTPGETEPQFIIAGKPSTAAQGNILEAINLASAQFAKDYIDRDLVRTGISVIVVTAGTGVFEVDYNMLKLTTDTLVGSGIGIDLVCLSPMPLHSVPLFKYRNPHSISSMQSEAHDGHDKSNSVNDFEYYDEKTPRQHQPKFGSMIRRSPLHVPPIILGGIPDAQDQDEWRYAMPHWVDVSFWSGPFEEILELAKVRKSDKIVKKVQEKSGSFALRCRMYELQMMGVTENELGDISIPYLEEDPFYPQRLREKLETPSTAVTRITRDVTVATGTLPSNETEDKPENELEEIKQLLERWMDDFDSNVFTPRMDKNMRHDQDHPVKQFSISNVKHEQPEEMAKSSFLASSYRNFTASIGKTARPPPDAEFPQLTRNISREADGSSRGSVFHVPEYSGPGVPRADVLARQMAMEQSNSTKPGPTSHRRGGSGDSSDHRKSRYSTPRDSPAPSRGHSPPKESGLPPFPRTASTATSITSETNPARWFLRQISFGGRKGAAPKATTEAAIGQATIDITPGKVKPAKLALGNENHRGAIAEKLASTRMEKSQPIAIRSVSRAGLPSDESSSPSNAGHSVETVKGLRTMRTTIPSHPGSVVKDPGSTFLLAGSRALGDSVPPKLDMLSTSGGAKVIPRTLSPTSAIAPWAVLVNPCNPKKNNISIASQFRRWQHVFPKRLKTASVKWKSLCSPAAVPLTNEYFPSPEQLATEYNESPYKITQNDDEEMLEAPKSRESLVRELIAFRLSHGFQIIVGSAVADFSGRRELDLAKIFDAEYMSRDGDTVFLSIGNTIHQLVCVAGGEVEIKRYSRKPTTALQSSAGIDTPFPYKPYIRTAFEDQYEARNVILRPPRKEYNWNFIDTFLAGYQDEFSEVLRFWRARFVLIPVDLPTINRRPLPMLAEDSEEEIRLEGIRKLTQVWQKYRYIPPEERHFQATNSRKQKDPNPLAIEYQTRDPSAIVAAGADNSLINDTESEFPTSIFSETEQYHTSNIDIKKLAEDIQGEGGVPMLDRRWHMRLHYNCFLGFDLTSWLLSNFKDVDTRDEAVDLGNQLMKKGLFHHVQKRHAFRDGNFFYSVAPEYRAPRPESKSGWFGMRKSDRSVPSTPLSDGPRSSPLASRGSLRSRPSTGDSSSADSEKGGEKTPTRSGTPKRKVLLSRVMRYDVDPRKRSYRPEIISLHYDRLSNPDNCYHIRIDWMNVTAKLIEDAIVSWATSVEKYGLKLVEVPIAEASNIADHHPFREPYIIKLALQPPQTNTDASWDSSHFSTQYTKNDRFAYHKALLRRLNFVLDIESADSFPTDVEVAYSWGSPDYKYTQFIHKSGTLMAQILHDGNFAVLANRLAHNRAKDTNRFRPTDPYEHKRVVNDKDRMPTTPAERANPHRSPFSSPLARPVQDSSLLHSALQDKPSATPTPITATSASAATITQSPEQVKDELEAFCSNATLLQAFYATEVFKQAPHPSPSPRIMPVLDNNIPALGLPPAINVFGASPANSPGWSLGGSVIIGGSTIAGRRQGNEESNVTAGGDSKGLPVVPVRQVINANHVIPTLLKQNALNASHWAEIKKPTYHIGKWPPTSVEDILGSPAKEEECGVCDKDTSACDCDCDYQQWSAQMQIFWIENIRISLTPSKGYGVFARSDFKANQVLGEYTGELVPIDKTRSDEETQYLANINIGKASLTQKGTLACRQPYCCIDAASKGSVFRFLNHSCDHNAALILGRIGMSRRVMMIQTTKPIAEGEEITIDYGPEYFQPEWNHTITHDDYTKMLNGHTPRDMDDKVWIKAKVPEAQSNAMFHIYYGWKPREVIRLEIVAGDPNNTEAKEWATIIKIWWKKEFSGEEPMTEEEAKKSVINTCNNMLGCKIEHEDEDEGETEENEDEDKKEKDKKEKDKKEKDKKEKDKKEKDKKEKDKKEKDKKEKDKKEKDKKEKDKKEKDKG